MAGIDKTYVTKKQFVEVMHWCKAQGLVTLENGYQFYPTEMCFGYNGSLDDIINSNDDQFILWNTSCWFDRWLWKNCPLDFIREQLKMQYDTNSLKDFDEWDYRPPIKKKSKFRFLNVPKWRGWKTIDTAYEMFIVKYDCEDSINNLGYDRQTNAWYPIFGMLPTDGDDESYTGKYIWNLHHKNIPNKKTIIRQIKQWNIPSGYLIRLENVRYDINFEILVE